MNQSQIHGVGLNYINEFFDGLKASQGTSIQWLEVRPENYFERGGLGVRMLDEMREMYPFAAHTISLSLGSPDPLDWEHLKKLKRFIKHYQILLATDHIATFSYQNKPYQFLLPVPWTESVALWIAAKAKVIQDYLEIPFGLENITYYHFTHQPQLTETDFINLILEKSNCHLLLDVNDLLINAHNYHFDPREFLQKLNLERLIEMHVAGCGEPANAPWKGQHACPLTTNTLAFLKTLAKDLNLPPILFEWENHAPSFDVIQKQIHPLQNLTSS